MNNITMPSEISMKGTKIGLLLEMPVNSHFILGIYQGTISKYDMLIKYRQKDDSSGNWSRVRTPKHIHWAVDVLIKMNEDTEHTKNFLDFLIDYWNNTAKPIKTDSERDNFLNKEKLLNEVNDEAKKYPELANKGEYSVKFLILLAKLLMIQEKSNYEQAFMFKNLLNQLRQGSDIFKIVSTATHH